MTPDQRAALKRLISETKRARILAQDRGVRCLYCGDQLIQPVQNQLYCGKNCRNAVQRVLRARSTRGAVCKNGHMRTPETAYIDSYGYLRCRACRAEVKQRYREAQRARQKEAAV